jgi:hypothetical protein
MSLRVRKVLLDEPGGKMDVASFIKEYQDRFDVSCSVEVIKRDLFDVVKVIVVHCLFLLFFFYFSKFKYKLQIALCCELRLLIGVFWKRESRLISYNGTIVAS